MKPEVAAAACRCVCCAAPPHACMRAFAMQTMGHVHAGGNHDANERDWKGLVMKLTGHYDWSVASA